MDRFSRWEVIKKSVVHVELNNAICMDVNIEHSFLYIVDTGKTWRKIGIHSESVSMVPTYELTERVLNL